ncbi:MAG: prepilin-type N-terminal cleavage/methylation domain-containing protein [Acidobacteriota bacterium]|nr:prepilin-type N-terminal cleavage/methylation domain-containing protein [Acidobacteriota bacterium]
MSYLQGPGPNKLERGDTVKALELPGRRVTVSRFNMSRFIRPQMLRLKTDRCGFTLIELVITITVLTIMTLGIVPLLKLSVKRQKEQQMRDSIRQIRTAIDEFHRDTIGMVCTGTIGPPPGQNPNPNSYTDPRSKVVISDCTIFGVDNPDRYPPDLETLVSGVNVVPRAGANSGGQGLETTGTSTTNTNSVLGSQLATKKKVYLRAIPIDPMTGDNKWDLRSCYDPADADSWGGENVFDVRSKSKGLALNGEKYSDW